MEWTRAAKGQRTAGCDGGCCPISPAAEWGPSTRVPKNSKKIPRKHGRDNFRKTVVRTRSMVEETTYARGQTKLVADMVSYCTG